MGQIVGGAAKPKRCNLNKLSQLGTPAAGEYILVSSDNSMNAAGQGNFDCYIEGNGQTAATALELRPIADKTPTLGSKNSVTSGGVKNELNRITDGEELLDLSQFVLTKGVLSGNIWSATANVNHQHKVIPVAAGQEYHIVANGKATDYGFLRTYTTPVLNAEADFCDGYTSVINLAYNGTADVIIPNDCSYLYIKVISSGQDVCPSITETNLFCLELAEEKLEKLDISVNGGTMPAEAVKIYDGNISNYTTYENDLTEGQLYTAISVINSTNWTRFGFSNVSSVTAVSDIDILVLEANVSKNVEFTAPDPLEYPYIVVGKPHGQNVLTIEKNATTQRALQSQIGNTDDLTTEAENLVDAINELNNGGNSTDVGLSLNVFGDVIPQALKEKMLAGEDDILIACVGDSLTGLIQTCNPASDPAHRCAGGQYLSWVSCLQEKVGKVRPNYYRVDAAEITKVGTWQQVDNTIFDRVYDDDNNVIMYANQVEKSVATLTYRSADSNAAISFAFNADTYDKCNIFFTKYIDSASGMVSISEGNGKMLASIDRETWVEANGFTHSPLTARSSSYTTTGIATIERHRRIWLKKVDGVSGTINITYGRTGSDGSYLYCWGVECYKGRAYLFDNIGRGGRNLTTLGYNITDIFDRNPDGVIMECPLANDLSNTANTSKGLLRAKYDDYFLGSAGTSFKQQSNDYTDTSLIVLLPHGRTTFWDGDNAILAPANYQVCREMPAYDLYKFIYGYLHSVLKNYPNVSFVNLGDQLLNEFSYRGYTYEEALASPLFTDGNIHLRQLLANIWVKYLAPIFQL